MGFDMANTDYFTELLEEIKKLDEPEFDLDAFASENERCKDYNDIKKSMEICAIPEKTYLVVLAVSKDQKENKVQKLSCSRGVPIGGYIYDSVSNAYRVNCKNYFSLGYIPISFKVKISEVGNWETHIPMPEIVLIKYMNDSQKIDLREFKNTYSKEEICFLQMAALY